MARSRWSLSVVSSLALGLGAAVLVLLAGGHPAAAAPVSGGDGKPAPAPQCFARDDSATGTVYSSANSAAVRQAVAAAVPNDFIRLAGTCAGVAAQAGTTQTVVITQPLTLEGGYSIADWADSFPITQPTTLDALSQGRVITASANITIAELTVQNGHSFGGKGGGIFAGANLTAIGNVNILSNTTLVSTTIERAGTPNLAPSVEYDDDGGGADVEGDFNDKPDPDQPSASGGGLFVKDNFAKNGAGLYIAGQSDLTNAKFSGNTANTDGAGAYFGGNANIDHSTFTGNTAAGSGGGFIIVGTLHLSDAQIDHNGGTNGAGLYTESGATLLRIVAFLNVATYGGGFWAAISENQVNGTQITAYNNQAVFGAVADFYQVLAIIYASQFNDNTGTTGGALYFVDATGRVSNSTFARNQAMEGRAIAVSQIFNIEQLLVEINYISAFGPTGASSPSTQPLAASSVLTGSAFAASGVSLAISDTIVSGFPLALQTDNVPSSTISGDYNLFDHTPVISGTNITTGTHSLVGNPLFADALGHLSAGSPAIDHGIDVGINTDLDGNPRPSGAGFDIGAYEFQVALAKLFLPLVRR